MSKCDCASTKIDFLSEDSKIQCENALNSVGATGQQGTFSFRGLIGLIRSPHQGEFSIAMPSSFGVFIAMLTTEDPNKKFKASLVLIAPTSTQSIDIRIFTDVNFSVSKNSKTGDTEVEPIKPVTSGGLSSKGYNWQCLALCAPLCYDHCKDDIACWAICAGGCIITCALPDGR